MFGNPEITYTFTNEISTDEAMLSFSIGEGKKAIANGEAIKSIETADLSSILVFSTFNNYADLTLKVDGEDVGVDTQEVYNGGIFVFSDVPTPSASVEFVLTESL